MPRNGFGFLCCVLLMGSFVCVLSSNLPDYIHICHRSDPKVSKCIKSAVEALRPKLIQGIPELGVPGIDPFHIDRIIIFDGAQNPNLKAHLENIEVMGAGNFEVTKLKLDVDKMTYRVGIKVPYLHLEGDYNVDAKILQAPIVGHGKFHANTTGLEGHVIIQGYIENKRLEFKSLDFKILLHDFNVKLDNLFGGSNEILTPYIKVCKRNDPNLSQCVIEAIDYLRPKLKEGIPELNVPSIEPLPLNEIWLKSGSKQAQINANITNLLVHGPSTFKILDLKVDVAKTRYLVQFTIPTLAFEGDYEIDMNILFVNFKGKGPVTGKFKNYVFDLRLKGDIVGRNNKTYLKFRNFDLSLHPGTSELHLKNLFGGNNGDALKQATDEVISENTDILLDEIRPALEKALSEKFTAFANSITSNFIYDDLFP